MPPDRQLAELNRALRFAERDMDAVARPLRGCERAEQTVVSLALHNALIEKSELLSKLHDFEGAVACLERLPQLEPLIDHAMVSNPPGTMGEATKAMRWRGVKQRAEDAWRAGRYAECRELHERTCRRERLWGAFRSRAPLTQNPLARAARRPQACSRG